jgi:hypothetical protein
MVYNGAMPHTPIPYPISFLPAKMMKLGSLHWEPSSATTLYYLL